MKNILRFSGMGIQMAVFISLGAYLGHLIDQDANRLLGLQNSMGNYFFIITIYSFISNLDHLPSPKN